MGTKKIFSDLIVFHRCLYGSREHLYSIIYYGIDLKFLFQCTGMTAMLRIALISVTCVLVVISLFTFIAGIVCYHYISQRWRASADTNKQPGPKDMESELELKENVAYITLRPAA